MPYDNPFGENLSRMLRMSKIFGEPTNFGNSQNQMLTNGSMRDISPLTNQSEEQFDAEGMFNKLYQPENVATDRLNEMLTSQPQRNNPGWLRKIAAVAASASSPENVDRALYSPYHRELQDWQTELAPTMKAAELERANNTNARILANNMVSQERGEYQLRRQSERDRVLQEQGVRRLAESERRNREVEDDADRRIKQSDTRIKIAEGLAKGGTPKLDDAGNLFMIYRDGSSKLVSGGEFLSFEDRQNIIGENRVASQRSRVRTYEIEDPENPERKIVVNIDQDTGDATPVRFTPTKKTQSDPGEAEPLSDTEEPLERPVIRPADKTSEATKELGSKRVFERKVMETKGKYPRLTKYIETNTNGTFKQIKKPGMIWGSPSQEEYDTLYQSIYGKEPSTNTETPVNQAKPMKPARTGHIKIRNLVSGLTGDLPKGQTIPQGWEEVK